MSGIFIAGLIQTDADQLLALLKTAGAQQANPSERDESMTLSRWHDQLFQIPFDRYTDRFDISDDGGEFNARQDIGRLWEQLASDIFIANLGAPIWAWSDKRSADVLPFWSQFDPQLKFILLVCSPERFVANNIENSREPFSTDALIKRWHSYHASLLHFSRSNPSKVLLLRAEDALLLKASLLKLCADHFKLPFVLNSPDDPQPLVNGDFSMEIAARLCTDQYPQEKLFAEIQASLTPLSTVSGESQESNFSKDQAGGVETLLALTHRLRQLKSSVAVQKTVDSPEIQQELSSTKQELETKLAEVDRVLKQLDLVQVDLEKYFNKHQETQLELELSQTKFQKLLARVPGYVEFDSLEISKFQKTSLKEVKWDVRALESAGRVIPELGFTTHIEAGVACLQFRKDHQGTSPLLRWPYATDETSNEPIVTIAATGDEITGPSRAKTLQALSTSDWLLVQTLIALLIKEVNEPERLSLPTGFDVIGVSDSLVSLRDHLAALPKVFHFDEISVRRFQEDLDHEYLWFSFSNVLFGDCHVPRFEFRFSSVNVPAGNFGSNPRLEFHEHTSRDLFEGWFEESSDGDGAKLELRFAQPSAMDMDVWARLSQNDQSLIGALVAELPVFMQLVKDQYPHLSRSWDDWSTLSQTIHGTLLLHAIPFEMREVETDTNEPEKPKLSRSATRSSTRRVSQAAKAASRGSLE